MFVIIKALIKYVFVFVVQHRIKDINTTNDFKTTTIQSFFLNSNSVPHLQQRENKQTSSCNLNQPTHI